MIDRLRILILNEDLGLGGVETMTVQLANSLSEQAECDVFVAAADGPLSARLLPAVCFNDIPKLRPPTIPALVTALSAVIAHVRPQIVHSQGASIAFLARIAARREHHLALNVLTRHSRETEKLPAFVGNRLMKWSCNHVIAISGSTHDDLRGAGFDSASLSLIPNFLDLEHISTALQRSSLQDTRDNLYIDGHRPIIAMTGRLIPAKRFDRFIQILADVGRFGGEKPVGLVIGEGVARPQLQALAAQHAETADIRFLGYQEDIYPFLAVSNAYLFPSEHPEVLPMALIEALAAGLPIICSDIPGNRDIITHGYNGLIVNGPNLAYAEQVIRVLQDQQLAGFLSNNACSTARQTYDRRAVVNNILQLYKELVGGSRFRSSKPVMTA